MLQREQIIKELHYAIRWAEINQKSWIEYPYPCKITDWIKIFRYIDHEDPLFQRLYIILLKGETDSDKEVKELLNNYPR